MSRHSPHTQRLRGIDRFRDVSDRDLEKVASAGTYVHEPANWTLMEQGTGADKAYVILSGTVSVRQKGTEIATLGAGDLIGEMGIVDHRLRTASVVSTSKLEVLHFTSEKLERLADDIPAFGKALSEAASSHLDSDPGN